MTEILESSKLSEEYNEVYFQMLQSFQKSLLDSGKTNSETTYSFLYPSFGSDFFDKRKILFYGQCINGKWTPSFGLNDSLKESIVMEGWQYSNSCDEGEKSPLDWVNKHWSDYAMFKSFFWQVAFKLTNRLMGIYDYKNSEEWSKYMAWSNLMKIGNIKGGNPNSVEYQAQIEFSIELFIKELEEIKPEIAVLLTGKGYAEDFISALGLSLDLKDNEFVIFATKVNQTKLILTKRPMNGNNERCVTEILEAINQL